MLYHTLDKTGWPTDIPPDVQSTLQSVYYATAARNLLIYQELARILAHFRFSIADCRWRMAKSETGNLC